jgi:hypothetical protein
MRFCLPKIVLLVTVITSAALCATSHFTSQNDSLPFVIRITLGGDGPEWGYRMVSIFKDRGSEPIHQLDILIEFENADLTFEGSQAGDALKRLGWESFACRQELAQDCEGNCPTSLLRIIASPGYVTDPEMMSKLQIPDGGEIAKLKFLVQRSRGSNCYLAPIRFSWRTCGNNSLLSTNGDSLFSVTRVIDYEAIEGEWNEVLVLKDITGTDSDQTYSIGGKFASPDTTNDVICCNGGVVFIDGGVEIGCVDIDVYGDVNLDGIIDRKDLRLLAKAIMRGPDVLIMSKSARRAAMAASDVNRDGLPLTIADLMTLDSMIRRGDYWSGVENDSRDSVRLIVKDTLLSILSSVAVNNICAIIECDSSARIKNLSKLNMIGQYDTTYRRMTLLLFTDTNSVTIEAPLVGKRNLLSLPRGSKLVEAQAADTAGSQLVMYLNDSQLPSRFGLAADELNPADSTIRISLFLPELADWTVLIHEWNGRVRDLFTGRGSGSATIDWKTSGIPKGDYRCSAMAGSNTITRLLKKP